MTEARAGMMGERAMGMTERVNIGKDGEKPVGKTRGRTVERTGIPGRAGNDGGESWNDGGENNGKDKGAKGFPVEPGMTERKQRESSGKGEGRSGEER